jgi:hypothetical protein
MKCRVKLNFFRRHEICHISIWDSEKFIHIITRTVQTLKQPLTTQNAVTHTHTERKEHSMTFAKIRQNKKFILGGLIKKWCGWE